MSLYICLFCKFSIYYLYYFSTMYKYVKNDLVGLNDEIIQSNQESGLSEIFTCEETSNDHKKISRKKTKIKYVK